MCFLITKSVVLSNVCLDDRRAAAEIYYHQSYYLVVTGVWKLYIMQYACAAYAHWWE